MTTVPAASGIGPLRDFVTGLAAVIETADGEDTILAQGGELLRQLVADDAWLPAEFAQPDPGHYQQYLLHCDSRERFSVVSFVWGPGQGTPIHDHRVWGLVGILRGAEAAENFSRRADGSLEPRGPAEHLAVGAVERISPSRGDIHRVSNALADRPSISIHVYGGNIGAVERATYSPDGTPKRFISGYANSVLPNLWDKSRQP